MAYKEVQDLNADEVTPIGGVNKKTGRKNPTQMEGYYVGSRKVESKKAKNGYAYIHILQTDKGNRGIWGKTDLDRKLLTVDPGNMVKITFLKMVATPNGDMYTYNVQFDPDNFIEVTGKAQTTTESFEGSNETVDEDDTGYAEEESQEVEEEAEEVYTPPPQMTAAERKAKVQAVINKGKAKVA